MSTQKIKYVLVDDSASLVGGTALTLKGLIEPVSSELVEICSTSLTMADVFSNINKVWIFGNIHSINEYQFDLICSALSYVKFFKIDFDYGYCDFRGRKPHQYMKGGACDCNQKSRFLQLYDIIKEKAIAHFFMSDEQMNFFIEDVCFNPDKCYKIGSCFSADFYDLIDGLRLNSKNKKYAIIDGQGGWHSKAKGVDKSISFAKQNNIDFDLIKDSSHTALMDKLSRYFGIIFLPIIHDTCPRVTIEAKLLGLDLKINNYCQHISEDWWSYDYHNMVNYLKSRPQLLWSKIKELSSSI